MIIARRSFTQMKKTLILGMALFLAIPFTACKGGGNKGFKDYTYKKDKLEDTEKYALLFDIQAKMGDVSSIVETSKVVTKDAINSFEQEVKSSMTVFSNHGYEAKSTTKTKRTDEGVTRTIEETTKGVSYLEEEAHLAISKMENEDGVQFETYAMPEENAGEYFDQMMALTMYAGVASEIATIEPDAFKVDGGWEFVKSFELEGHVYDDYTNVETINIMRSQWVMTVDKEYKIKAITTFAEELSNEDPETGEHLKKVQQFYQENSKTEYKYGKKKAGSFSDISNEFSTGYLEELNVAVTAIAFTKPAEEWVPTPAAPVQVAKKITQTGAKAAHFEGVYQLNTGLGAERTGALIQLTGTAQHKFNDTEPKAISLYVSGEAEKVSVTTIAEVPYLMLAEEYYTGTMMYVEFDIAYEAGDAGATVSNLVIKLIPPVEY